MARDQDAGGRIISLDGTQLACLGPIVEAIGIPVYVSDVAEYAEYGLEESGWYLFARVKPLATANNMRSFARINSGHTSMLGTGQANVTVDGAAGYVVGPNYVDVAVRFEVAAQSCEVTIHWGPTEDKIVFRATDLAVRNLDYRTTFYIYDLEPYCTWAYALTTDATFVAGKQYYTLGEDGEYHLAEVTAGAAVPADTYYKHTKLTIGGMVRNVTYKLDTVVDCPIEVVLPAMPSDGYGAWYELQMRYDAQYSMTLTPPTSDVKAATDTTPAQTKGINIIDLHYADVAGSKVWRLINTHYTYAE